MTGVRLTQWLLVLLWALPALAADIQTNIGSYETLQTLTASTPINCGTAARHRTVPVVGTGAAPVDLSALTPTQIVAGTAAGQLCDIVGTDATATVELGHGNGLTLTKGSGTIVLGLNQTLAIKWTGAIWVQRGPVYDLTDTYTITPPADQNVTITTSGTGELLYNGEEVLIPPLTLQSGSALWDGTFLECDGFPPCVFQGPTLEYRIYENGGIGQNGWFDRTTNLRVSTGLDIAAGNTDTVSGNGLPMTTDDGTTALRTVHSPVNYCADAGGDDTYVCTMTPALDRYVTGATYFMKVSTGNTSGASVNINGLGVVNIKRAASGGVTTDPPTGDICANQVLELQYDGTNMQLQNASCTATVGTGVTSKYFDAYALTPDGTNCVAGVVTPNASQPTDVIFCADSASSVFSGKVAVSDIGGCPAGALTFTLWLYHSTTESSTVWHGDFQGQYRRPAGADVINSTYSSIDANSEIILTIGTAHEIESDTATLTPNGTCSADAMLLWKFTIDTATTANMSMTTPVNYVLGVKVSQ